MIGGGGAGGGVQKSFSRTDPIRGVFTLKINPFRVKVQLIIGLSFFLIWAFKLTSDMDSEKKGSFSLFFHVKTLKKIKTFEARTYFYH